MREGADERLPGASGRAGDGDLLEEVGEGVAGAGAAVPVLGGGDAGPAAVAARQEDRGEDRQRERRDGRGDSVASGLALEPCVAEGGCGATGGARGPGLCGGGQERGQRGDEDEEGTGSAGDCAGHAFWIARSRAPTVPRPPARGPCLSPVWRLESGLDGDRIVLVEALAAVEAAGDLEGLAL